MIKKNLKKKKPRVYCAMSADIIHPGHINILKIANRYGKVIVGLLTDKAVQSYKNKPTLKYLLRKEVMQSIKYVTKVIPQKTLDYSYNLKKIKPKYVVHGDDWKRGPQKQTREKVIKLIREWRGKLIEPKYTENVSSTLIKKKIKR